MIHKLMVYIYRLPIRWKLILWSSLVIFVLFTVYNIAQYFVINHWMKAQQLTAVHKNMTEMQNYFQMNPHALEPESLSGTQRFLDEINQNYQVIRILDVNGSPLVTAANQLSIGWISPQSVDKNETLSVWHLEDHLLLIRSPIITSSFKGTIEIFNNLETIDQLSNLTLWVMLLGGAAGILLSGLGGLVLARQLLHPVQLLAETMTNVKHKGLHERVRLTSNRDELSDLANLFNGLMDQLETSFRQQKQFVEDASHELRTPISIIEGHLKLLTRWGKQDPEILDESLAASVQEVERLKRIVQGLLQLTRTEAPVPLSEMETINLYEAVKGTVNSFSALHPDFEFQIELDDSRPLFVHMIPFHLEQILLIVLDNAVKYSFDRQYIQLSAEDEEDRVWIHIRDQGIGIPSLDLPYVFDRFYRVDKSRSHEQGGTGLGLAIAKRLVEYYGGKIIVASKENQGTTVSLCFLRGSKKK
jgi:two-component system sensor histidine kinase ArlS